VRSRFALVGLTALLVAGGCSDDDASEATTSTSSLDPGVTFEDDVTVPTDPSGSVVTTTVPVGTDDVETFPRQVPDEFPADFPTPALDDATLEVGSVSRVEGELRVAVDWSIAGGDPFQVYDDELRAIDQAGLPVLLDDSDGEGQEFVGQIVFETDTYVGNVLVSGDGADGVLLTLTATLPD